MDISSLSPEHKALLDSLRDAIVEIEEEKGREIAEKIISEGIDPRYALKFSIAEGAHSVGKNIVATMLKSGGFEVHDMGVDVPSMTIIQTAKESKADMIALSSLLTTTMPYQREVIEDLKAMGVRDQFRVMIGGGPVTKAYAEEIGADAYGRDALEALEVAKKVLV